MKKKIIALALTALLALSVFALPALADETPSGEGSIPEGPAKETGEDGNAYVFGFGLEGYNGLVNGNGYQIADENNDTTETFPIAAGYEKDGDSGPFFQLVTLEPLTYTVTSVSLVVNSASAENPISLKPWDESTTPVLSLTPNEKLTSLKVYERKNTEIDATLTVTVSYNGGTQSFYMNIWRVQQNKVTIEGITEASALNEKLEEKAAEAVTFVQEHPGWVVNVEVFLTPNTTYDNIVIPSRYGPGIFLYLIGATRPGDVPAKVHSIQLASGAVVSQITGVDFVGTDKQGTGLSGGPVNDLSQCSFTGYQTAVAMDAGQVNPQGCTFTGNTTALEINFTQTNNGSGWQPRLEHNTFLNNDTAVKIAALPGAIRYNPYYLRFTNNDFAGNTTDFDVSRRGDYYFYENYFGDGESLDSTNRRDAVITPTNGAKIHWLPAWDKPVDDNSKQHYYGSNSRLVLLNNYPGIVTIPEDSLTNRSIEVVTDEGKDAGAVEKATWTFTNGGE